tara:strand:- start:38 stop:643 length:606 start_codon:yes stop_codon:yes gene_type:complete
MEKEQNSKSEEKKNKKSEPLADNSTNKEIKEKEIKLTPEEKINDLEDKLTRTLAEMENQRRRFEKEKEDAFEYGGFSFARESLNLIDNFDRAKQSLENDEKIKGSDVLKKTLEHLEIVKKDLISIFKKNNIEEISAIGKKLNPNFHQAMMEIEDNNKEPGTIVQEIQKGYIMKDRLLRPSLVGVSKKTKESEEKSPENPKK